MNRVCLTLALVAALLGTQLGAPEPALALYILAFGDSIGVTVKDAPQYGFSGAIRPDGDITVPFIGDLEVAGLTPTDAGERIRGLLARFVSRPEVTVTVSGFHPRNVYLIGQIGKPGVANLSGTEPTLIDTIAQAGGFTNRAVKDRVTVFRGKGSNTKKFTVDVQKMLDSGDFSDNMVLTEGDRIQVPEVWYPDFQVVSGNLSLVVGFISTVGVLLVLYNQASAQPKP
jgi:polysaccharide export outer membrane protein